MIYLSQEVLDLEKDKDAQAVEILILKKRVKRLERQRNSSTSQPRRRKYRQVESSDDDLEDASKQGKSSDKTEPILLIKELLEKMLNLQLEAEEESLKRSKVNLLSLTPIRIRSWRSLGFLEPVIFGNLLVSGLFIILSRDELLNFVTPESSTYTWLPVHGAEICRKTYVEIGRRL
ncbi:hypothetical protein Tco_1234004 [Tanacetum coccineum]